MAFLDVIVMDCCFGLIRGFQGGLSVLRCSSSQDFVHACVFCQHYAKAYLDDCHFHGLQGDSPADFLCFHDFLV